MFSSWSIIRISNDLIMAVVIVLMVLAVLWYLISEWFEFIKNPDTRMITAVTTAVTLILLFLIYHNPEVVKSLLK